MGFLVRFSIVCRQESIFYMSLVLLTGFASISHFTSTNSIVIKMPFNKFIFYLKVKMVGKSSVVWIIALNILLPKELNLSSKKSRVMLGIH